MPKQDIWYIRKDETKKKTPVPTFCGRKNCRCQGCMLESLEV